MKPFLKRLGEWLIERLTERSTYVGFALLAATTSHHLPQDVLDMLSWWGPFISTGLIAASTKR